MLNNYKKARYAMIHVLSRLTKLMHQMLKLSAFNITNVMVAKVKLQFKLIKTHLSEDNVLQVVTNQLYKN